MANTHLKVVAPAIKKRAVTPRRRPNSELRSREHLTETEVEKLIEASRGNRYGHRDATMILVAYRHGLRASEVCDLRWEQIDWNSATLHVRRPFLNTFGDESVCFQRLTNRNIVVSTTPTAA
jgi:integrase